MCDFIGSACLMANVFLACKDRESFRLREVRKIGDAVESRLKGHNVMVLWTRPAVLAAFHDYSDMFVKHGREVHRKKSSQELFSEEFIDAEFNYKLPHPVVSGMRQAIQEFRLMTDDQEVRCAELGIIEINPDPGGQTGDNKTQRETP